MMGDRKETDMSEMPSSIEEALRSGAVRLVPGWQDISTAPKDGTVIDLWARSCGPISRDSDEQRVYVEFRVADACWFMGEWSTAEGGSLDLDGFDNLIFSHWAPRITPSDAASPDHTAALLALIEERDRLKVERDGADAVIAIEREHMGRMKARALAAEAERDRLKVERDAERADAGKWFREYMCLSSKGPDGSTRPAFAALEARALAAEAKCDALREALGAEREACAAFVEAEAKHLPGGVCDLKATCRYLANEIRARALTQETNDGE